jgi:hypothetical protein
MRLWKAPKKKKPPASALRTLAALKARGFISSAEKLLLQLTRDPIESGPSAGAH